MRGRRHFAEKIQQVFVDQRIFGQKPAESAKLFPGRQFSVNQEPCGFRESRVGRQVFDIVSAVTKNSLFPIDKGYLAFGAARVGITVVQRDKSRFLAELGNIDSLFIFRSGYNRKIVGISSVIQGCEIGD